MKQLTDRIPPGRFPRERCAACSMLHLPRDVGRYVSTASLEAQTKPPIVLCLEPCGRDAVASPTIKAVRVDPTF